MTKYYEIKGTIDGQEEILFGSFSRDDVRFELDAERDSWKDQGYTGITMGFSNTDDQPDPEVYADDDDVDTSGVHFFATCALGWASAETRDEAIRKLVNRFLIDFKSMVKGGKKNGDPGAYVWTCQVNAPADAEYSIEYYQPRGVDIEDGREHAITKVTNKTMEWANWK